jgi:eukaryotic-like serine/threonine-protein kinase
LADEIFIDDYQLLNHISTGSSTQVWEAADKGGGDRRYAMKVMLPEALAEPEQRSVLKHEAKLAEKFEHLNIVRFHKLVLNKKRGYILMDYFRAPNLKTQLQTELISVQARLPRLLEQLCQVLGYLHALGWVHRDIKPENILFNKASELRLIDFSLTTRAAGAVAKMLGSKERVIQGTRTYISPETILKAPITPRADIYSLGVTLFEILTGDPPYRGNSPDDLLKKHLIGQIPEPSAFNPNVSPEMDRMILKMLSKNPKKRQEDTNEVLAEFRNIKPFKEDVIDVDRRRKEAEAERYKTTLDKAGRLDSRADAERQQFLRANPDLAKELAVKKVPAKPVPGAGASKTATAAKTPAAASPPGPAKLAPAAPQAGRPQAPPPQPVAQQPARPQQAPQAPASPQQMPNQPMPMHQGYPANPYGYPGYAPQQYPMPGYPVAHYPQPGYPQPQYPGAPSGGYPQGYPPQPGAGPPSGYLPAQAPYGAAPYGSQMHLPPAAPQRGSAPPAAQRPPAPVGPQPGGPQPGSAQPGVAAQQQLLQQLMGQPAPAKPAPVQSAPVQPAPARPQAPANKPPQQGPAKDLPLMDQLPPVK